MRQKTRAIWLTVAALGALTFLPASIALGQASSAAAPGQPLSSALEAVCREAGLQLVYSSYLGKGVMTHGAAPGQPFAESMKQLLRDTGLTYEFVNDHTVTIVQVKQDKPASKAESGRDDPLSGTPVSTRDPERRKSFTLDELLAQIIVTGTHITGVPPVGGQLLTLTRTEIDRSGYATVHDVIRTLPQNFNGGASEDYQGTGQEGLLNTTHATGVNLRGLGSGSTLVLLNGRRLASGAAGGRFVDISGIPLSAVERIEIVPDGASAIYGADAVGGVVNIILRTDYDGTETLGRWGSATSGPAESLVSQAFGQRWSTGSVSTSAEFYSRDALRAADRRQTALSNLARFGGDNFDVLEGSPGTITDFVSFWAVPRGQDGRSLSAAQLVAGTTNSHNRNAGRDLLPEHDRWSIVSSLRQKLNERVDAFGDALVTKRKTGTWHPSLRQLLFVPRSNPFYVNPSGGQDPIGVYYGFGADFGLLREDAQVTTTSIAAGLTAALTHAWKATTSVNFSSYGDETRAGPYVNQAALSAALADSNAETAFNPFGDGSHTNPTTLAAIRQNGFLDRNLDTHSISFSADGPFAAGALPGARLAVGGDFSEQSHSSFILSGDEVFTDEHLSRRIIAPYLELMFPLVDETARLPWAHKLQLSLAVRHESYSDFGSAASPRFGLSWVPFDKMSFRGTWSKSFKPPNLIDLQETHNASQLVRQNSADGGTEVLVWYGPGNRDLQGERSTAWTLGTTLTVPERRISAELTYFSISFRDRVERVDYTNSFLTDPAYADLVTLHPSREQRLEVCNRAAFFGTADHCLNAPITAIVDMRLNNVAALRTSGFDILGKFKFVNRLGSFDLGLNGTYLTDYSQARFRNSPLIELLSTTTNPIDFRLRGSFDWTLGNVGVSAFINYADGYRDIISNPPRRVAAWTTLDLQLNYNSPTIASELLANTSLSLSVENLFDKAPPFVNNPEGIGYDNANADLLGRFVSFRIRKDW